MLQQVMTSTQKTQKGTISFFTRVTTSLCVNYLFLTFNNKLVRHNSKNSHFDDNDSLSYQGYVKIGSHNDLVPLGVPAATVSALSGTPVAVEMTVIDGHKNNLRRFRVAL